MHTVMFDVGYTEDRDRLTTAFRLIWAIPHMIVSQVWGYLAEILAVVQWFIVLFTGVRNEGIWNLQNQWLGYSTRVCSYIALTHDKWPPFGADPNNVTPVTYDFQFSGEANRLTNALRFLWVIPAALLAAVIGIAAFFVAVVSWFTILFTGKHPRGMFDFLVKAVRLYMRVQAYAYLMTDVYPKYE